MTTNEKEAYLFAIWYVENKAYIKSMLVRKYVFDEDLLSDIFLSIYCRILNGVRIKDCTPYLLSAYKYKAIDKRRAAKRLVLVEDYNNLQKYIRI
jgi:DNA-directed RNA polymerase specialized sigma24 family protein